MAEYNAASMIVRERAVEETPNPQNDISDHSFASHKNFKGGELSLHLAPQSYDCALVRPVSIEYFSLEDTKPYQTLRRKEVERREKKKNS